jgi:Zn-dependent protease
MHLGLPFLFRIRTERLDSCCAGREIGLHYSWFIIAALIAFSLTEHFRQVNPSWDPRQIWIAALATAALFFATLLLHELAHSLVAQARGLRKVAHALQRQTRNNLRHTDPVLRSY